MALDIGRAPASVAAAPPEVVAPLGQTPLFSVGDRVRVSVRFPVGNVACQITSEENLGRSSR
jgi:hypothetical protein